ncbi:universal stress protein [Alkalisalibacterium limincola]|uniref:Universal stress protein n=1 Tax=Alkalisalibacterium limincola TaxID=2699169 RepID=A0A5C8KJR0_9GAMM|nr:universal stress protein [Alkalisalibacterium limincola]TXK59818.1 universal stress protein [Alkalisalibacterium limincola]
MTLLACIDGSTYTPSVRDHAIWAAQRLGVGIDFLHVIDKRPEPAPVAEPAGDVLDARTSLLRELATIDARRSQVAHEHGRLVLAEARAVAEAAGVAPLECRLRHGHLVETVEEFEDRSALIVIGKRGEHADFAKLHLGSNLERVVRATTTPLLVAARAFRPIRQAVIAFDGGASSRKAVELASGGKLLAGVRTHLVCAGGETAELRAHLNWAATLLEAREVEHVIEQVDGHPDQVIAEYVRRNEIDLLMMGAWGHGRVREFMVGATTTSMIRTCLIPVLLVR